MKIAVDCFGCDNPDEVIKGTVKAINAVDDVCIIACGEGGYIENVIKNEYFDKTRLEIMDTPEIITNNESPVAAVMSKKDSSLVKGLKALKSDDSIKAFISAGSTGAVLAGSAVILGRCENIE